MRTLIYLAAPYTKGDPAKNTFRSMSVAGQMMKAGLCVFNPLLSHFQNWYFPSAYLNWMELDLRILDGVDLLVRLPGESAGADREVLKMEQMGKPVFFTSPLDENLQIAASEMESIMEISKVIEDSRPCGSSHRFRGGRRCLCGLTEKAPLEIDGERIEYDAPVPSDLVSVYVPDRRKFVKVRRGVPLLRMANPLPPTYEWKKGVSLWVDSSFVEYEVDWDRKVGVTTARRRK